MKPVLLLFIFLSVAFSAKGQGMVVPLTERGYISTEKPDYQIGDTMIIRGVVLSTDYDDFYPYSRYVNIELIDDADSLRLCQKVTVSQNGYFYATIPTHDLNYQGKYYLRSYTQFMRNQPSITFPMCSVYLRFPGDLNKGEKNNHKDGIFQVSFIPEGNGLMECDKQNLIVNIMNAKSEPVSDAKLAIISENGDTLAQGRSNKSGYDSFILFNYSKSSNASLHLSCNGESTVVGLPDIVERSPFIRIQQGRNKLMAAVINPCDSLKLYSFQTGFGISCFNIQPNKVISLNTSGAPDGLVTFWLKKGEETIDERTIWVGSISNSRPSTFYSQSDTTGVIVIKRLVDKNSSFPHAFEALNILQHVHSNLAFPSSFYQESTNEAKKDLDYWLASAHFIGFSLDKAIEGNFEYPFNPEKSLTIKGSAKTREGRPLTKGSVEILNLATMDNHICQLDESGTFEQEVGDFATGNKFFLESVGKSGENEKNRVSWEEVNPPIVHNWLRKEELARNEQYTLVRTNKHGDDAINLDEVTVRAVKVQGDYWHTSRLNGMLYFDHEELQRPIYHDLEALLIHTGMVDVILNNGNHIAIWRGARYLHLTPEDKNWIKVLLNDVLLDEYDFLFSEAVNNFESIEIVRPSSTDPRLIRNSSPYGLIILKSRHLMKLREIPSNGITIEPMGIDPPLKYDFGYPPSPGENQSIAVDVITPERQIISWVE